MKALVTGASGMIGAAIVDALLARGHSVRALVRASAKVDPLLLKGVDLVVGDLGDAESLRQAVQGVDAVFHAAAALGFQATAAVMDDVNVGGTERLLAASRAAGVGRFVYISSVAVYGPHEPPIDEATPQQPSDPYGRSKQAAEAAVMRAYAQGLPTVILRPCIVYGAGDRYFLPTVLQLTRLPIVPLPDGGDTLIELVYVTDLAEAALQAATRAQAVGQAYNITDGRPTTLRDIIETYALLTGHGPRIVSLDLDRLVRLSGALREALLPLAPRVAYLLDTDRLANLRHDIHYDIAKAERELGYAPQIGLYEGLRRALEAHDPAALGGQRRPNSPLVVGGALALGGLLAVALARRALRRRDEARQF